ncbi:MAG: hypothetical protein HC897_05660 [Thermoanaerobaculia bacterium]|nr:hypothetical protein [Thermoanaerobaculia bacterium]
MTSFTPTPPGSLMSAAQAYARDGWSVIPLQPRGKKPLIKDWVRKATTDVDVIRGWWRTWPWANIGIVIPALHVVVDIDSPDAIGRLRAEDLELPASVMARTCNGTHTWYLTPGLQSGNRVGILPGIDIRAAGGYVVAPPSVHATGAVYKWQVPLKRTAIAEAPDWLLEMLRGSNQKPMGSDADRWVTKLQAEVHQGSRNQTLTEVCGFLFHYVPAGPAAVLAQLWASSKLKPPLAEKEVQRTIQSIASREARHYGE